MLIVDAGGGTVDLTAYKRTEDKSFIEIAIPKCQSTHSPARLRCYILTTTLEQATSKALPMLLCVQNATSVVSSINSHV